jgi:UDP-glucose 4-epimerase
MEESLLEPYAGRRCLVTGGLGFIGSNLAVALDAAGAEVVVVDSLVSRHGGNRRNLTGTTNTRVVIADISDRAAVGEPAGAADVVFNLAGQVSHVDSMADPQFDLEVNARSQLGFLDLLRSVNPEAVIVFTSTRQIFGHPHYLPVDEEHPVSPVDVNGITKWAAEQFHMLYHDVYGLRSTSLRLTNVYGPRQRLRDNFQGFLPIFVRLALEDETITVFGDGSQERDCLYVDDVVECLLRAGATDEAAGEFFNIGNDERLSLREIADAVVVAAGSGRVELGPWPRDRDAIDIGSYYGDSSKAKRILGWSPSTDFADGIAKTVEFYERHRNWYL